MDPSAEGVSLAVLFIIHFSLLVWATKKIFHSKISGFEKSSWFFLCFIVPILGSGIYAAYEHRYLLKRELLDISIAVVALGFLFSFGMWGVEEFSARTGVANWLNMSFLAFIALGLHIGAQKRLAKRYGAMSRFRIWGLGIAIGILLAFLTNGKFIWAAVGCAAVTSSPYFRIGRKVREEGIMIYEISKIMAAGAFTSIGLAIIGKLLIPSMGNTAKNFMYMNLWIAVFTVVPLLLTRVFIALNIGRAFQKIFDSKRKRWLMPFGDKQYLQHKERILLPRAIRKIGENWSSEGELMFFGSRPVWIFTFIFVVVSTTMLLYFGVLASVLVAALLATATFAWWHWKLEPQKWMR